MSLPEKFKDSLPFASVLKEKLLLGLLQKPLVSVRTNPFKPVDIFKSDENVPWSHNGKYLKERPEFVSDPMFHSGAYYPQEASSMFLGQILSALKKNRPFFMVSGRQLREYHHYDDEAEAIKLTVKSPLSSIITLSHGNPIDLNSIANSIFDAFGKRELLHSIEEVEPDNSIYEKSFPKNTVIKNEFRDPLFAS